MTTATSQILPGSGATDYTTTSFIVAAALAEMQTVSVCEVVAVNTGALTVDVKVLVNLMTATGQSIPHGVISGRPYFRLQGGGNGIICDPAVGDIGVVVFASRDLSAVIATKGAANPGSQRQFDWADGIYFGGILNGAPTQYVQFLAAGGGINIVSPGAVAIQAPATTASGTLNVTGNTTLQATLAVTGTSTLTGAVSAPGGLTTTTIAGASAMFSGSVTASSFIGGGGGGDGTVTSVGISTPGVGVTVGGGPITAAGTLTVDLSSTAYAALALAVTALQSIPNTSVTPGNYTNTNLTVGADGRLTAASNGTSGSTLFNITPDSHPSIPTGVGLGPNDEFETGSTLDTAGTRYSGATAWGWLQQNTATIAVASGAAEFTPQFVATNTINAVVQAGVSGSSWSYQTKASIGMPGTTNYYAGPIILYESSSGKLASLGFFYTGSTFEIIVGTGTLTAGFTAVPATASTGILPTAFATLANGAVGLPAYFQVSLVGGNLVFSVSQTGYPGSFFTVYTVAMTSVFTTAPNYVGFCMRADSVTTGLAMWVDWFRRTA